MGEHEGIICFEFIGALLAGKFVYACLKYFFDLYSDFCDYFFNFIFYSYCYLNSF